MLTFLQSYGLCLLKGMYQERTLCLSIVNHVRGSPPLLERGVCVRETERERVYMRAPSWACLHPLQIRSVAWNTDDSKLISCGTDGAVYEWSLSTGKRETECVLKSCSYNCVTISPDGKIIFAVGSDQTLKEIADSSVSLPPSLLWAAALICRRQLPVFTAERGSLRTGPFFLGEHLPPHPQRISSVIVTSGISCPVPT